VFLLSLNSDVLNSGTLFPAASKIYGTNQNLSPGKHISVEFWAKDFIEANPILLLKKAGVEVAKVTFTGGNYLLDFTGGDMGIVFTGIASNTPATGWVFVAIAIGWDGTDVNGGMACISSKGTALTSVCLYDKNMGNIANWDPTATFEVEVAQGSATTIKEFHVEEFFKVTPEFNRYAGLEGVYKMDCRRGALTTKQYPNRICEQCGN
jgi:hypothetical protein